MKNKKLIIIFIVLLGIAVITFIIDSNKKSNFSAKDIKIDTNQISKIEVYPKGIKSEKIIFEKKSNKWMVSSNKISDDVNSETISQILSEISKIRPLRLAAKKKEKWEEFKVTDSSGSILKVYQAKNLTLDLIIGKFSIKQMPQQQQMMMGVKQNIQGISFIRMNGTDEVFATDGFLSFTFQRDFASWRNSNITNFDFTLVNKVKIKTLDSEMNYKKDSVWNLELGIDTTKFNNYIRDISNLSLNTFADGYKTNKQADFTLELADKIKSSKVEIWQGNGNFYVKSSENSDTYFKADSSFFSKIIKTKDELK